MCRDLMSILNNNAGKKLKNLVISGGKQLGSGEIYCQGK